MSKYEKRREIISYVSPYVVLFPTEYALVFGTRHGMANFADDILSLYSRGYFKGLIISGGVTPQGVLSESWMIRRALVRRGIPKDIIILEDKAMNTVENVVFSRDKMKGFDLRELLLIGKLSSKRRYIMTVKRQWPEIGRVCCHGVNYFSSDEAHWWKDGEFRRRVLSECRKLCTYVEKDLISDVSIVDGVVM